jgi:IS5 family transposase
MFDLSDEDKEEIKKALIERAKYGDVKALQMLQEGSLDAASDMTVHIHLGIYDETENRQGKSDR